MPSPEQSFSPGPWTDEHDPHGYPGERRVWSADGRIVAAIRPVGGPHATLANARLIATAPDFFAAAEEALRYISDDQMVVDASTPFMVMLAAAYKKALDARPV